MTVTTLSTEFGGRTLTIETGKLARLAGGAVTVRYGDTMLLVLEGILPFIDPGQFRKTLLMASRMNDSTLRGIGFASMIGGVALLYVVR